MIRYIDRLILFEAIHRDEIACNIAELAQNTEIKIDETTVREIYYSTGRILQNRIGRGGISGNYLQDHLCRVIASEENSFARMAEHGAFREISPGMSLTELKTSLHAEALFLLTLAAREIKHISPIYRFDFNSATDTADGRNIAAVSAAGQKEDPGLELIHEALTQNKSMDGAVMLAHYYQSRGYGVLGCASAFSAEEDGLAPIPQTDPFTMDDIIGCESQKRMLTDNTAILLAGHRANNVLLYGDSGTGKSSSVKALLNEYAGEGLKLISITKDKLHLLPMVFEQIADRGMKFIIFIDDLSFEEDEREYKAFKSIVEGRIAPSPKNAVFIVTTNRKNIVKEVWEDRGAQDDVRRRDNIEEKRSLSDRFGITLVYSAPDKQEYLAIVRSIAEKSGLHMPDDELVFEALKWEIRHGGRSGRTARQFVDYMAGIKSIETGGSPK